jgi:acetyl esterase/lipase
MVKSFTKTIVAIAALAAAGTAHADEVAPVGVSAFYAWQDQIPATPGKLLRREPLEEILILENAQAGLRILYASNGWNDQPVTVSGAVFTPKGQAPAGGWPVLAWSHGTVGVADICAPSHAGRSERDVKYLNKWLAAGYAIVATDYEGLGTAGMHTYLHCQSEANGNIDAVRASQELDLDLSNKWLVIGQSQGGQGALCTGGSAATRAPELDFLGVLATAPAVFMGPRFHVGAADDPNPIVGYSLMLARGFETYEPTFNSSATFTDAAMALMPLTDTGCGREILGAGMQAGLTLGESQKIVPFGDAPGVMSAAEKMKVPIESQSAPIYIGQGSADPVVRAIDVVNFSAALCENGVDVTLEIYEGLEHSGPLNTGFAAFQNWVSDRFAGKSAENTCPAVEAMVQ